MPQLKCYLKVITGTNYNVFELVLYCFVAHPFASIPTRRNVYQDPCHSSRARGDFSTRIFQDVSRRGCRPCVSGYRVALFSQKAKLVKQTNNVQSIPQSKRGTSKDNEALEDRWILFLVTTVALAYGNFSPNKHVRQCHSFRESHHRRLCFFR